MALRDPKTCFNVWDRPVHQESSPASVGSVVSYCTGVVKITPICVIIAFFEMLLLTLIFSAVGIQAAFSSPE